MNAETVFTKTAKKLGLEYIGKKKDGAYLFGYFKNSDGEILHSFYHNSIKKVVEGMEPVKK